ncbi:dimethyl sulfoxide reductase anchor subunit [Adlercreutzia equolifaciens]|uniref:DmsC/YnfH family molybdoenzyme membrane anchor subunit n=1 Tax=Adlercreutzia equolifaciens TaxID=446660 RepID=UPI0023AED5A0|nr:DmsC/YnfH family molybdoenzyme membrane anchor subunit [Adlercreutzia equolifaciens]MDE8702113.1 dimethyl sulfoxide reductase anchor subunit [Adlercreutzia equolifaciens]
MSIQWSLVLFTWLTGAGGCLFAFIGFNELVHWSKKDTFAAGLISLVLVVVGGLASVTHLAHPDRMLNALAHPTSGIFIEAVLVGIAAACFIVYLICARRQLEAAAKVLGVLGGIVGLALSFMAGHSYIMEAQEAWATIMLPVGYLTTALATGAGLWWALLAPDAENGASQAAVCGLVAAVLALVCVFAYAMIVGGSALGSVTMVVALICEVAALALAILGRVKSVGGFAWAFVVATAIAALLFRAFMWTVGGSSMMFF